MEAVPPAVVARRSRIWLRGAGQEATGWLDPG